MNKRNRKLGNGTHEPELNPPANGAQGVSNDPCVALWATPPKLNVTVSPATTPDTWSGVKVLPVPLVAILKLTASTPRVTIRRVARTHDIRNSKIFIF